MIIKRRINIKLTPFLGGLKGSELFPKTKKIGSCIDRTTGKPLIPLSNDEVLAYMPEILGINKENVEFRSKVLEYFRDLNFNPGNLYEFNLDFQLNAGVDESQYLKTAEGEKYKIGNPTNAVDYILYRYCLVRSTVANKKEFLNLSKKIYYYLEDLTEIKKEQQIKNSKIMEATLKFASIMQDAKKVTAYLREFEHSKGLINSYKGYTLVDLQIKLKNYVETSPSEFLEYCKNENLEQRETIYRALLTNVMTYNSTSNIFEYTDSSKKYLVLGNTIDNVLNTLNDPTMAQVRNEIYTSTKDAYEKSK